jgi:hypothetical protein
VKFKKMKNMIAYGEGGSAMVETLSLSEWNIRKANSAKNNFDHSLSGWVVSHNHSGYYAKESLSYREARSIAEALETTTPPGRDLQDLPWCELVSKAASTALSKLRNS